MCDDNGALILSLRRPPTNLLKLVLTVLGAVYDQLSRLPSRYVAALFTPSQSTANRSSRPPNTPKQITQAFERCIEPYNGNQAEMSELPNHVRRGEGKKDSLRISLSSTQAPVVGVQSIGPGPKMDFLTSKHNLESAKPTLRRRLPQTEFQMKQSGVERLKRIHLNSDDTIEEDAYASAAIGDVRSDNPQTKQQLPQTRCEECPKCAKLEPRLQQLKSRTEELEAGQAVFSQQLSRRENDFMMMVKDYDEVKKAYNRVISELFLMKSQSRLWVMARVRGKDTYDLDGSFAAVRVSADQSSHLKLVKDGEDYSGKRREQGTVFEFEYVFGPSASNRAVFDKIEPLIEVMLSRHNVCIITDGPSGAGKSHTMFEGQDAIAHCAAVQIFSRTDAMVADGWARQVECTAVEIYLKDLEDLLADRNCQGGHKVRLGDQAGKRVVAGCEVIKAHSALELQTVIQQARQNRRIHATRQNAKSSRGHFICTITLSRRRPGTDENFSSKLVLVDLAGSERSPPEPTSSQQLSFSKMTESDRTKQKNTLALREQERKVINSERQALHSALQDMKRPVRQSLRNSTVGTFPFPLYPLPILILVQLTQVLSNELDGESRIVYLVNVSPPKVDCIESAETLKYASQVSRQIPCHV